MLVYILIALVLFVLASIYSSYKKRKKQQKVAAKLQNTWAKPKEDKTYYSFENIKQYFINTNKADAYHVISNTTKDDLDFEALFKFIDRTSSKIGQQYLYYKISTIGSVESLKKFGSLAKTFSAKEDLRLQSQLELAKLDSYNAYDLEKLIHNTTLKKPTYIKFLIPLSLAALAALILSVFFPAALLFIFPIFAINLTLHLKNKSNITYYISAVSQLNLALSVSKKLASFSEIKTHFTAFGFINEINTIKLKTKFIAFEENLTNEFAVILWYFIELVKILFNIETIVFYSFIDDITIKNKAIDSLFQFIGEVDCAIAVASIISSDIQTCEPIFNTNNRLTVEDIQHPLVANCIANSIVLNEKSLLLTGSNMSGKTTFIRSLALNSILAQTLNIAFSKLYDAPFYKVYSSIRISDNLTDKTSYYLKEVLIIKQFVEAAQQEAPCLFVLDEIFKGTNTIERISGGKAILSFLNKSNHTVLVSTHDIELADLLKKENYELYHFSEIVSDETLHFDHKLKKGKLKTRNAIKILEIYDYPSEIIKEARAVELKIS